jgi:hypothetical protein
LSEYLQGESLGIYHPLLKTVARSVTHDIGDGGAKLLPNYQRYRSFVFKLPRQRDEHVHANFEHDKIVNPDFQCPKSFMVQEEGFRKVTPTISAE